MGPLLAEQLGKTGSQQCGAQSVEARTAWESAVSILEADPTRIEVMDLTTMKIPNT